MMNSIPDFLMQLSDLYQFLQEPIEALFLTQIPSIRRGILGHQDNFYSSPGDQLLDLPDDRIHPPAPIGSPQARDEAEGAGMRAPLCYLYINRMGGIGDKPGGAVVIEITGLLDQCRRIAPL